MNRSTTFDPLVGQLLDGRYRVGERIARGGMATVYEGTDLRLDRRVAIKVMPHQLSETEEFTPRFVREARAAARLSHPNVVAVYDQGDDGSTVFLVMEYVPGGTTLRDVIRNEAPLPPVRALDLAEEILVALTEAHEAHLIHRDIKPENVLITPDGRLKVADFGLARAVSSATASTATSGVLMGTVSYMAPELVTTGHADARSDVYAVGVVLHEMLTGHKPYEGESPVQIAYKHVHEDMPLVSASVAGIPPYVDALVARATARAPESRPADARDFLRLVRRVRHALEHGVTDDELTADLSADVAVPGLADGDTTRVDTAVPVVPNAAISFLPPAADVPPAQHPPNVQRLMVRERRARRRGVLMLVLVLLLAAIAAAGGWYYGVGRYTSAPDVIGRSESSARTSIESAGLHFRIAGTAYSESIADGDVVSTDPGPGDRVLRNGTVAVVLSRGPERHAVPDLVGLPVTQAVAKLRTAHLGVGPVERRWSGRVPTDHVISSAPAAQVLLKRNAPVMLVVSKGRQPIHITNFEDSAARRAKTVLSKLGFQVAVTHRSSESVAKGVVMTQTPNRGTGHRGDTIALVVSSGPPLVTVPNVFHSGVEAAKQVLRAAGFRPRVRFNTVQFGLGFVIGESPSGGSKAPKGSVVVLTIV
jgi:eukaryotic-like serine/threonine-protein kinase